MKQKVKHLYHKARPHIPQLIRYLLSGGSAAFLELSSYQIMLVLDVNYAIAAPISGAIGLLSAFVFHKYLVFQKKEKTFDQAIRYAILQTWNFLAQWGLVVLFVEVFHADPTIAKILGIGATVSWNFFLYKLFVYV